MASVGKGRVVGAAAALARLAMACGIGCMVFALAVVLILSDGPMASRELAAAAGLLGAMWTAGGLMVAGVLRIVGEHRPEQIRAAAPSWHNQPTGHEGRPARRPAPQTPARGWWTVLGVPADAPPAIVEGAARGLLRQCHPDRWATADAARRQDAEERTRNILQALAEARAASGRR